MLKAICSLILAVILLLTISLYIHREELLYSPTATLLSYLIPLFIVFVMGWGASWLASVLPKHSDE